MIVKYNKKGYGHYIAGKNDILKICPYGGVETRPKNINVNYIIKY